MFKCKFCGREFEKKRQLVGHIMWCKNNPNRNGKSGFIEYNKLPKEQKKKNIESRNDLFCQYCGKQCKNIYSLKAHERLCKLNPNRQIIKSNFIGYNEKRKKGEITSWNKGLTKETDERVLKMATSLKEGYACGRIIKSPLTEEGRKRIQISAVNCGGYKERCGRGKNGWYKGIWCDSSWELAFVIYHLEHNLFIERCHDVRTYEYDGKVYKYYPDFITDEGICEIKGYYSEKSKSKHIQHPDIKMIFSEDMKIYLDYVIKKYGRNFIKLYE